MRARFTFRVRLIAIAIVLVSVVLVYRLFEVQIVQGNDFRRIAEGQYAITSARHFDRGSIFFTGRDGSKISAATLDTGYTLTLVPNEIDNPSEVYTKLENYLEVDAEAFFEKAGKDTDAHQVLSTRVPAPVGDALFAADIDGVRLSREWWRLYPAHTTAAHTVGFIGFGSGDTLTGQYGLERFYDEVLTKANTGLYVNFFANIFADVSSRVFSEEERPGADVVTAIEPTTQGFLEETLRSYKETWSPTDVGAIIMDPRDGTIIALAALPTFDPNKLNEADPNTLANPLVERVYEFGSIVKPLTVAAGIDAEVITPETEYTDRGFAEYDTARIENFDGEARGVVSMQEVLNQSLNTGVAFIVEELGTDAFANYMDAYGITEETGIDLPGEALPLVSNLESPRTIEYVTAAFGQGFAVTPVSMARALATLANDGLVPAPHVATELKYPDGSTKKLGWSPEKRALKKESAETVTTMLVEVVDTALRAGEVKILELSVAAKTGTAQIAKTDELGYYEDRFLHSFFGYFPAYDPEFLVFLYAVAPRGARYASETWTDPFMETVSFLTTYYDVQPDRLPAQPGFPVSESPIE